MIQSSNQVGGPKGTREMLWGYTSLSLFLLYFYFIWGYKVIEMIIYSINYCDNYLVKYYWLWYINKQIFESDGVQAVQFNMFSSFQLKSKSINFLEKKTYK